MSWLNFQAGLEVLLAPGNSELERVFFLFHESSSFFWLSLVPPSEPNEARGWVRNEWRHKRSISIFSFPLPANVELLLLRAHPST